MAYFANGTEGEILDRQCADCIHEDLSALCPVYHIMMTYNYDQLDKGQEKLRACLNILIQDEGGLCAMKPLIDKMRKGEDKKIPESEYRCQCGGLKSPHFTTCLLCQDTEYINGNN